MIFCRRKSNSLDHIVFGAYEKNKKRKTDVRSFHLCDGSCESGIVHFGVQRQHVSGSVVGINDPEKKVERSRLYVNMFCIM